MILSFNRVEHVQFREGAFHTLNKPILILRFNRVEYIQFRTKHVDMYIDYVRILIFLIFKGDEYEQIFCTRSSPGSYLWYLQCLHQAYGLNWMTVRVEYLHFNKHIDLCTL